LPDDTTPITPISTETGMWFVGQLATNGDARYVKGFIINGNQYAFLADSQNGLQIIDITNASSPSLKATYKTFGNVKEVYIDSINGNKYAFVSDVTKGLFILNINNLSQPVLDTLITYPGVNSIKSKNGYLLTALLQNSVKIININSLPDSVYEVSSYIPKNTVEHIEISGNYAYFIERVTGIEIVDLTILQSLTFLSTFKTSGSGYDLKIADNLAYIADGNSGVCVINISDPSRPYFINQTNTNSDVRGIDFSPNFMFTAEYNSGAEVFNLFNPTAPESFGYFEPDGNCFSVHYFKGKVLIANGQYGLLILRF
jgi:hypothetical protein